MRKFFIFLPVLIFNTLYAGDGLDRLLQGNKRFAQETLEHPNRSAEKREALESKQEPFAVIVGCSDSRVSPEILFDQGVGDLFVVRVAGNVVGPLQLNSIEYSVLHLHSSVVLVMGHENCGAVDAVIQKKDQTIEQIAKLIAPAIADVKKENPKQYLAACTKANAIAVRDYLVGTPIIKKLIEEKKVEVVPAYYNMTTGYVEVL